MNAGGALCSVFSCPCLLGHDRSCLSRLVALSQSPVLTLTTAMATHLEALGLAQPGFGGTVISAAGRELIWKRPAISSRRERRVR